MNNQEIRAAIRDSRLRHYEVAEAAGVSPYTLSVWLRYEMSEEKKGMVNSAIKKALENLMGGVQNGGITSGS